MNKVVKRVIVLALTASLVLGCSGCKKSSKEAAAGAEGNIQTESVEKTPGSTENSANTGDSAETKDTYTVLKDENGKVYDLGGMEITIADWWSPEEEAEPANAKEEDTKAYRDWIQKTYNFKIKQVGIDDYGTHPETFINFATSGGDENYVFILYTGSLAAPMKSGLFYDLSTLNCLDFNDNKWNKATKKLMTKGKAVYGMRAENNEPSGGLYFNKRLLEEANINPESLYEMQADGTWTWDAFKKICEKTTRDTNNDGVLDTYALTNFSVNFYQEVIASNNASFIGLDKNGKFFNATGTDEFLEAMNWGYNILKKYEMPQPEGTEWDYSFTSFVNGEAAMNAAAVYQAGTYKDMEDDYGFVCFPKGPNADTYHNIWSDNVYVIPACYDADRAWKIAFAFNLYSEETPGYEEDMDWQTDYYENFRDTRAVDETISILKSPESGTIWYSSLVPGISVGDIIYGVYANEATPAEKIEEVKNQWQAYIDEANK